MPSSVPAPEVLDAGLAERLQKLRWLSTEVGIWSIWTDPSLLAEIGATVARTLDRSEYDAVVGVCAIGSALAWVLAYHARFPGPVYSSYESPGILPVPGEALAGKRVLVVQGRIITAQDTEAAIRRVEVLGGRCRDVLALKWAPEQQHRKRRAPLHRLCLQGIRFMVLCD